MSIHHVNFFYRVNRRLGSILKIYDKPSLKRVASLQKFTAAQGPIPSYCDYPVGAALVDLPEDCDVK